MKAWEGLALVVLAALGLAALALRPPAPLPADAPLKVFSAGRAMADVVAIAQRAHPLGSADEGRVQAYLMGRMTALGLSPQAHPFASPKGEGRNLVGVLPGEDRRLPALLLMAHADSVPAGPGAADDAAGVAAVLETVRALAGGPRGRDVMVLVTDGEEPGLLGAQAFFTDDPDRAHAGVVINLEARGNRGRAVMFETYPGAAPLIGRLINKNALGGASSLMPDLYRRLPNKTDLTVALQHGYQALNFAFFGGLDAYHRPGDTPQALDRGSLQHIGEQALAAARVLVKPGPQPVRGRDQVYADVLGGPIVTYPAPVAWGLLGLAAAGIVAGALRAFKEEQASLTDIAGGAAAFLALCVLLAVALWGEGQLRRSLAGDHFAPLLRHPLESLVAAGLLTAGVGVLWLRAALTYIRPAGLGLGALATVAAATVILQAAAPMDAFVTLAPLVLAVTGMILTRPDTQVVGPAFAFAACAQIFYWSGLIFALVGQTTPVALTPFAALAGMSLLPLIPRSGPIAGLVGLAGLAGGLGLAMMAVWR